MIRPVSRLLPTSTLAAFSVLTGQRAAVGKDVPAPYRAGVWVSAPTAKALVVAPFFEPVPSHAVEAVRASAVPPSEVFSAGPDDVGVGAMAGACDVAVVGVGVCASGVPMKPVSGVTAKLSDDAAVAAVLALGAACASGLTVGTVGAGRWAFARLVGQPVSPSVRRPATASKPDLP